MLGFACQQAVIPSQRTSITAMLRQFRSGDAATLNRLTQLIYPELRRIAAQQLRSERPGHLLQPTALVNEAYCRLVAHDDQQWANRVHFFGTAAEIMRRILVDHARANQAKKRGGGQATVPIDETVATTTPPSIDVLALDAALTTLAKVSPRQARIVELRYFAGLSVPEAARALGVNASTVDRDWATAKAWLRRRLRP
jgi:RNA polymerase sigma factor (TIGR02999 family)